MADKRPSHTFTDRSACLYYEPHRKSFTAEPTEPHRKNFTAEPHRKSFTASTFHDSELPAFPSVFTPPAFLVHNKAVSAQDLLRRISSMHDPPTFATTNCDDIARAQAQKKDSLLQALFQRDMEKGNGPEFFKEKVPRMKDTVKVEFIRERFALAEKEGERKEEYQRRQAAARRSGSLSSIIDRATSRIMSEREMQSVDLLEWKVDGSEKSMAPEERRWEEAAEEEDKRERSRRRPCESGCVGEEKAEKDCITSAVSSSTPSHSNELQEEVSNTAHKKKKMSLIAILKKAFGLKSKRHVPAAISTSC